MNEKFILGLAVGMLGGAILTLNSKKVRTIVSSGQNKVLDKIENLKCQMDENGNEE